MMDPFGLLEFGQAVPRAAILELTMNPQESRLADGGLTIDLAHVLSLVTGLNIVDM